MRSGERFDSYVNDYAARIQRDGKAPLVAKTFAPMRAADEQGVKRRVDLGLASEGTVVKSGNAGVKLSIAKTPATACALTRAPSASPRWGWTRSTVRSSPTG